MIRELQAYIESDLNEDAKRPFAYRYFRSVFPGEFKVESNAEGADIYIPGKLVFELKTSASDLFSGFYQALHYRKKGLTFSAFGVLAHHTLFLWKLDKIPPEAYSLANTTDPLKAPNQVGKINAKKTKKALKTEIIRSAEIEVSESDFSGFFQKKAYIVLSEFQKIIKNLDAKRIQIDTRNFISYIELMERYFDRPIDAIHAFYDMVGAWDVTSAIARGPNGDVRLVGKNSTFFSEPIEVSNRNYLDFSKFVEGHYIFTNEGSGLTEDYYFSRFDEVIARLNPEYAKQHGIFFTDDNLSKFSHWFIKRYGGPSLQEDYYFIDPAGGSGNLVSSTKGFLKHKIVSELQPDLLRTIERRMKLDPAQITSGFTVVPRTSDGIGLNFLDKSAIDYLDAIDNALRLQNKSLDKPLAFIVNPPYKNTDENEENRAGVNADYNIHDSIIELTGEDAGKERYLAFLGQMLRIAKEQVRHHPEYHPLIIVFTPTSWLIPRPTYRGFREIFDQHFRFINGYMINSKEFFKVSGKWPLAVTMWRYDYEEGRAESNLSLYDFTELKSSDLDINWIESQTTLDKQIMQYVRTAKRVNISKPREDIRENLPLVQKGRRLVRQPRYNIYRNRSKAEKDQRIISGFPSADDRHTRIKAPHGYTDGSFIGFMDDLTPVRLRNDTCDRLSTRPDAFWFRLDAPFKDSNKSKLFSGPTDNRSYCAYDLMSAQATLTWFSITKAFNGKYPLWANQFNIWNPDIPDHLSGQYYSLCFAFGLAENRCVVTKFEGDNPVVGAPEIFVDNPLCPTLSQSFWATTLGPYIEEQGVQLDLVDQITELYNHWNINYCRGQVLEFVGLQDEAYFKYFDYPDFLTPYSGLIQIKKYAQIQGDAELLSRFERISSLTKGVREEIYRMMVEDFEYFE